MHAGLAPADYKFAPYEYTVATDTWTVIGNGGDALWDGLAQAQGDMMIEFDSSGIAFVGSSRSAYSGPQIWKLDTSTNKWVNLPGCQSSCGTNGGVGASIGTSYWGVTEYAIYGIHPNYWSMAIDPTDSKPYVAIGSKFNQDARVVKWNGVSWDNVGKTGDILFLNDGITPVTEHDDRLPCCPYSMNFNLPDIVVPLDGLPLVAYISVNNALYVRRYLDATTGWVDYGCTYSSAPIASTSGSIARIALDPTDGTPYVACRDSTSFVKVFKYDVGIDSWVPVVGGTTYVSQPITTVNWALALEIATDGTVYVGYADGTSPYKPYIVSYE
jgi:hypothetical protein